MKPSNTRVLIVALAANVGIAVAKFVAAAITGSSAMLTEGVHSLVDSTNQILLMYGQKRAAKPADATHPAGYGRELYFWSFVVALLVFALGAGVSVFEGFLHVLKPEKAVSPLVGYIVLVVAFALEGGSTFAAFREFDATRRGKSWWRALIDTKDATTVIVLLENGAAMAGILVAALGLSLSQLTGDPRFDGIASILIGFLLGVVAIFLAREAKGLLIGEAADPLLVDGIRRAASRAGVMGIGEIMTIHNAPEQIVAALNVDFDNRLTAGDVERIVDEVERAVQKAFPSVTRVYIRPHEDAGVKFGSSRGLVSMSDTTAFKVLTAAQWASFEGEGEFVGAPVDLVDGYIHLSTAAQLGETIAKHFADQFGLVVAEIDLESLGAQLRWEVSRGGALFPHHYGVLTMSSVRSVRTTPEAISACPAK